jgi:NADH-quinone oxidoreductase subunit D
MKSASSTLSMGPFHPSLPGPMKLGLEIEGEVVVRSRVESGFAHRGVERCIETRPWISAVAYADRLDPEASAFAELALCLAVEEILGTEVPDRAKMIRVAVCELTRISAHLGFLVKMSETCGAKTFSHYVLRDRERVLDLFELLTGTRFLHNYFRFGGVVVDVTEGFVERVLEVCDLMLVRLKEYNDLLTYNETFLRRTRGLAPLPAAWIKRYGVTGPNARASGVAFDVRKALPYSGYERAQFGVPVLSSNRNADSEGGAAQQAGPGGDAHSRFVIRLQEIPQSVAILRQLLESLPGGEFEGARADREVQIPRGEAYARVESSRGLLACYVASDGGPTPLRVQFRVPSAGHLRIVEPMLHGVQLQDVPVAIASLGISIAEADR